LFTLPELLRHDQIVPWDVYAVMLHARRAMVLKKPTPRPEDLGTAKPLHLLDACS